MVQQRSQRSSGKTTAEESAAEQSAAFTSPVGEASQDDMEKTIARFRSPGFAGLALNWTREDSDVLARARVAAQEWLDHNFGDVLRILNEVYDIVREKETTPDGEIVLQNGLPVWKLNRYGQPIDNWEKLTTGQRDTFLFRLVTQQFFWRQRATDAWLEAMAAKAVWDESYATGFESLVSGTIEDREARGKKTSSSERMFAIMLEYRRRLADALVRDVDNLALTLRDLLRR